MTETAFYLEGEDRQRFIERMLLPFENHEQAAQYLPVSKDWIDSYTSKRQDVVKIDTLLRFDEILEKTGLELLGENLTERVCGKNVDASDSSERPELREDWKKYIFERFDNRELAEMSSYSKQTVDNYSLGSLDRNPPYDFWEQLDEKLDEIYEDTRLENIRGDIIDFGAYGSAHRSLENARLAKDISMDELFRLDKMVSEYGDIKEEKPGVYTRLSGNWDELFQGIIDQIEMGNLYMKASKYDLDPKKGGYGLKVLEDFGVLDKWSDSSGGTYKITEDKETLERAKKIFSGKYPRIIPGPGDEGIEDIDLGEVYGTESLEA